MSDENSTDGSDVDRDWSFGWSHSSISSVSTVLYSDLTNSNHSISPRSDEFNDETASPPLIVQSPAPSMVSEFEDNPEELFEMQSDEGSEHVFDPEPFYDSTSMSNPNQSPSSIQSFDDNLRDDMNANNSENVNDPGSSQSDVVEVSQERDVPVENATQSTTTMSTNENAENRLSVPERRNEDGEPLAKCARIDSEQDGTVCPICFESWTNSGEHRLSSLKCGHLFGSSCITKWLAPRPNRFCPTCKAKSSAKDIRYIYARSISFVDNSEVETVKSELEEVKVEKNRKDMEIQRLLISQDMYKNKIKSLEERLELMSSLKQKTNVADTKWHFSLKKNVEIMKENGCRVFTHNRTLNCLYISQLNMSSLFPGYGVTQLSCDTWKPSKVVYLHKKEIRGLSYCEYNDLLMSISIDKKIKMLPSNAEKESISIATEVPLWSCCWDKENPYRLYVGGIGGNIMQYDIRQTQCALSRLSSEDMSPVVAIDCIPNGIISCQLNSIKVHRKTKTTFRSKLLSLKGPFVDMHYEPNHNCFIASTKPIHPSYHCKHYVCTLNGENSEDGECTVVNTLQSCASQMLMSKSCMFNIGTNRLFTAYNEIDQVLNVWDVEKQTKAQVLRNRELIIDCHAWSYGYDIYLGALSRNRAFIYKTRFCL